MHAGDAVYAGSFCISGRGAYVAQKVGDDRLIVARMADMPLLASELTPLERLVDRILRALLALVAIFGVLLVGAFLRPDLGIPAYLFHDAAPVIFSIAPSSLFLMIIVTYATGTADLAMRGALVHRARSVESLAEATVLCFAEAGILTGTSMEMESGGAQRRYFLRAYIPEGRGLYSKGHFPKHGEQVRVDDDLALYFTKELK